MNRRRLEVEPIRDTLLQLAGRLDLTLGGRVEEYDATGYVFGEYGPLDRVDLYDAPRRSIYMPVVRTAVYPIFGGFDFGDASDSVGDRSETVVPRQALLMMNSPFVEEAALGFAQRLLEIENASAADRVDTAFVRAYGRPAGEIEIADSLAFLDEMRSLAPADEAEIYAWTRLAHVILAASEFIYIN